MEEIKEFLPTDSNQNLQEPKPDAWPHEPQVSHFKKGVYCSEPLSVKLAMNFSLRVPQHEAAAAFKIQKLFWIFFGGKVEKNFFLFYFFTPAVKLLCLGWKKNSALKMFSSDSCFSCSCHRLVFLPTCTGTMALCTLRLVRIADLIKPSVIITSDLVDWQQGTSVPLLIMSFTKSQVFRGME